jgi:hypothetical protein
MTPFSINVKAKNIERSQAAPLSRVTSATHDPQRLFQQLQLLLCDLLPFKSFYGPSY